jgi:hypothetical protein
MALSGSQVIDPGGATDGDPPDNSLVKSEVASGLGKTALVGSHVEDPGGSSDELASSNDSPSELQDMDNLVVEKEDDSRPYDETQLETADDIGMSEIESDEVDDSNPTVTEELSSAKSLGTDVSEHVDGTEENDVGDDSVNEIRASDSQADESANGERERQSIDESTAPQTHDPGNEELTIERHGAVQEGSSDVVQQTLPDNAVPASKEEVDAFLAANDQSNKETSFELNIAGMDLAQPAVASDLTDSPAGPGSDQNVEATNQHEPTSADSRDASNASDSEGGTVDRIPTTDAQVEKAWNASEKVPAGRSFMPPGDVLHEEAEKIQPTPNEYSAIIHGNTQVVGVNHPGDGWQFLDPKQMAQVIRSDPDWKGQPVHLVSCDTGKKPSDGSPEYAQRLADELGVDVSAPTEKVYCVNGQNWVSSTRERIDQQTGRIWRSPNSYPSKPDGVWKPFQTNVKKSN